MHLGDHGVNDVIQNKFFMRVQIYFDGALINAIDYKTVYYSFIASFP